MVVIKGISAICATQGICLLASSWICPTLHDRLSCARVGPGITVRAAIRATRPTNAVCSYSCLVPGQCSTPSRCRVSYPSRSGSTQPARGRGRGWPFFCPLGQAFFFLLLSVFFFYCPSPTKPPILPLLAMYCCWFCRCFKAVVGPVVTKCQ
ncbi:hypothetical protein GGS23DRAFT_497213 [Durotheca rogersii]|uniref:uncharacterized protein n=1 Tax=Durotheca rogersii TaxID=419775 RepID=UPI002220CE7D|nr:uncharacterized protein GGS23DRAFT_497213 [Durotheca rogersii]KAI5864387.1 hypothetical protein GGS23DRAFT_497213 [Durotheca rogersii]